MMCSRRLSHVFAPGRFLVAPVSRPVHRASGAARSTGPQAGTARTGFTLIEVLLAAFVLALGVLGLAAMFAGAARQQQLASQQTRSVSVSQSADALISENVGKIGLTDSNCNAPLDSMNIYPGQPFHQGQWFVVPVKIHTANQAISFVSINPEEEWTPGNAYFREKPRMQLPLLIYRAVPDGQGRIMVGKTGMSDNGQDLLDDPPFTLGAPKFDRSFGLPRVLSDSVVLRVVTKGYACQESLRTRSLASELPTTITFTLNPGTACAEDVDSYSGNRDEHTLLGSDGLSFAQIDQKREIRDDDFARDPIGNAAKILYLWVRDVDAGDPEAGSPLLNNDINCDGQADYVLSDQTDFDRILYADGTIQAGDDRFDLAPPGLSQPAYELDPSDPTRARLTGVADLRFPGQPLYLSGSGPYTSTKPEGGAVPIYVKKVNTHWRFISEIWIDSFEYRGHRLVSSSDRVWYTQDPSRPSGRRADVAYSLLYRDLGPGLGAQYIVFTYALRPASIRSDYIPPERKEDIQAGDSPVTLVEDVELAYDDELARYYIEVSALGPDAWVAEPGQIVIFAGDGGASPKPILGADAPVSVQFRREIDGKARGYLASAPRIGNRSLLEFADPVRKFDVWAVQPTVKSLDGSDWGLRAIEARLFEVFEN